MATFADLYHTSAKAVKDLAIADAEGDAISGAYRPHYDDGDERRLLPALAPQLAVLYPAAMVDDRTHLGDEGFLIFDHLIDWANYHYDSVYQAIEAGEYRWAA